MCVCVCVCVCVCMYYFFFFLRQSFTPLPGWSALAQSLLSVTFASQVQVSRVAGTTGVHHHAQLPFVLSVEMRFLHVGQDGLNLLTSPLGYLGLQNCWDYSGEPPYQATYILIIIKTEQHVTYYVFLVS